MSAYGPNQDGKPLSEIRMKTFINASLQGLSVFRIKKGAGRGIFPRRSSYDERQQVVVGRCVRIASVQNGHV